MIARTPKLLNVNRAPVLTLWAAIVAEHMGFDRNEALTLGRAVAGLDAYSKGKALGLFSPRPKTVEEKRKRLEPGAAMAMLASSLRPEELAARAFELYEAFRPEIPAGLRGWGAAGVLDLDAIVSLARAGSRRLARRSGPS